MLPAPASGLHPGSLSCSGVFKPWASAFVGRVRRGSTQAGIAQERTRRRSYARITHHTHHATRFIPSRSGTSYRIQATPRGGRERERQSRSLPANPHRLSGGGELLRGSRRGTGRPQAPDFVDEGPQPPGLGLDPYPSVFALRQPGLQPALSQPLLLGPRDDRRRCITPDPPPPKHRADDEQRGRRGRSWQRARHA